MLLNRKGAFTMRRIRGTWIVVVFLVALLAAGTVQAQSGQDPVPDPVLTGGESGLRPVATPDTVRTNLWLVEALLAEIATEGARALPAPPTSVRLDAVRASDGNDLFRVVGARVLAEAGYTVILPAIAEADTAVRGADHALLYDVTGIDLSFPEVGRTLGLWRRWVTRTVEVSATLEVTEQPGGQLLMADRFTRVFHDRLDNDAFGAVNSPMYQFTAAETSESGWKRRTEELVVLGTLAGLIAVYFANTGN
jgi:hypothetical protein